MELEFLEFYPQCCDAERYLLIGSACAQRFSSCWDPLRTVGAALYFSMFARTGIPAQSIVFINIFLLLTSSVLSVMALQRAFPLHTTGLKWLFLPLSLAVHAFFFVATIFNSLSDAPSGLSALIAIWVLVAFRGKKTKSLLISGALFGISAWIRPFYLYPVFLTVIVFIVYWVANRTRTARELVFVMAALIPIATQYTATYIKTGEISYLGPSSRKTAAMHLNSTLMGYDTLLPRNKLRYESPCAKGGGVIKSLLRFDVSRAGCLVWHRQKFYFGSYAPRTYFSRTGERLFSNALFVANLIVIAIMAGVLFKHRKEIGYRSLLSVFLASTLAQGFAIIPEQRFLVVFHVFSWCVALGAVIVFAGGCLTKRRQKTVPQRM